MRKCNVTLTSHHHEESRKLYNAAPIVSSDKAVSRISCRCAVTSRGGNCQGDNRHESPSSQNSPVELRTEIARGGCYFKHLVARIPAPSANRFAPGVGLLAATLAGYV